jgi:hypothetical protein
MGRSPVQRSSIQNMVSECDREASRMRPWPTEGCCEMKKYTARYVMGYLSKGYRGRYMARCVMGYLSTGYRGRYMADRKSGV